VVDAVQGFPAVELCLLVITHRSCLSPSPQLSGSLPRS
jgi:hypothetical protein